MLKKTVEDQIIIACLSDQKTNAVTRKTLEQLADLIAEVNQDAGIKGLILTGEGRFFSSGFSLPMFVDFADREAVVSFFTKEEQVLLDYFTCSKPVVSAINGHCAAMGLILAMASDYRLVKNHPKIKLGMSEIKIGLGLTIAQTAVMRFGLDSDKRFRDVMYFGEMMDVKQALEQEMVDELVDEDQLISRAKQIISLWIDTPNQPFVQLKKSLKSDTAQKIAQDLATRNWQDSMCNALLNREVKATLAFVQAAMDKKTAS
ncbi:MAG TPA: enoyl-CoA hydratase/isomerase family protein [Desulfotignum sp.]|nr:enoyl-CoA hydratase/isomerase family protein [Desulfotignum sp.]